MATTLPSGTVKRISVNRQAMQRGDAPITIHNRGKAYPATDVTIDGPSQVRYDPDKPRSPRVWMETRAAVIFV